VRAAAVAAALVVALGAAVAAEGQTGMAPSPDMKVLSRGAGAGTTFIAALGNAPFPVGADALDHRGKPFWHGTDSDGQRVRLLSENRRYRERAVYSDARVLFHAAAGFDPAKPFRIVIFLHGHGSEIERTLVREIDLPGQIDRSGANAVLIAPQLALDAAESVPGKFVEPGRAAAFLDEAQGVLARMLGGDPAAWRRATVIVAAYSGGYRTAAQILAHGGVDARIDGVLLLDAIYGDSGLFAGWLARNGHRAFFHAIHTRSSAEETALFKTRLMERGLSYSTRDDGTAPSGIRLIEIDTPHGEVPRLGPPAEPIGALLRRLTR